MSDNYKIIEYNNVSDVIEGDFVKITIYFNECYDTTTSSVISNAKEHIWTHVTNVANNKVTVSISNHMFFKPIENPECLAKDELLVINRKNIKELKRYTAESHQNTINKLLVVLDKLPIEQQLLLQQLEPQVREEYFEQLLNTRRLN